MNVERLPHVIASSYQKIESYPPGQRRFHQIIRTYAATVRFLSLTALAEYLTRPESHCAFVDEIIGFKLRRLSAGHHVQLITHFVKHGTRGENAWIYRSSVSGLSSLCSAKGKVIQEFQDATTELSRLRNIYMHSTLRVPEDLLPELLDTCRQRLETLLGLVGWLEGGKLVAIPADSAASPTDDEHPATDMYWQHGGHSVFLPPFLLRGIGVAASGQVLEYETRYALGVKYIDGDQPLWVEDTHVIESLTRVEKDAQQRQFERELETRRERRQSDGRDAHWGIVADACWKPSRESQELHINSGKFAAARYAPRVLMEARLLRFVEAASQRLFIVVGDSGCGKTNLMCRVSHELRQREHAVLHLYGQAWSGTPIWDVLSSALGVESPALHDYLERCGGLPEPREDGRRLIVVVDAFNEYAQPEKLFRAVTDALTLLEPFPWIKFIVTSRPLPWQYVAQSFEPDYDVVFGPKSPAGERTAYHTLGLFTEDELNEAWTRWKDDNKLDPSRRLPDELRHLLHHPLLFRCYVDCKTTDPPPPTEEGILLRRFESLDEQNRERVRAVARVMWDAGTDQLPGRICREHENLMGWLATDRGDALLYLYACRYENHWEKDGNSYVYEEIDPERPKHCRSCHEPLVRLPIPRLLRDPRDQLRDEGFLVSHRRADGEELLRFTFDRMYEAVSGQRLDADLAKSAAPEKEFLSQVDRVSDPELAPLRGVIRAALLTLLSERKDTKEAQRALALLDHLAASEPRRGRQSFLADVLHEWSRRAPRTAKEFTTKVITAELGRFRRRRTPTTGLLAGLEALAQQLARSGTGCTERDREHIVESQNLLLDIAMDDGLTLAERCNATSEEGAIDSGPEADAVVAQNPNDLSLALLGDYCRELSFAQARRNEHSKCGETTALSAAVGRRSTEQRDGADDRPLARAVDVVDALAERLTGLRKLWAARPRLRAIANWAIGLVGMRVRDDELLRGTLDAFRRILSAVPLLGPKKSWLRTVLRRVLVLSGLGVFLLKIFKGRVKRLFGGAEAGYVSPRQLAYLRPEDAPACRLCLELLEDIERPLDDETLQTLRALEAPAVNQPFAGVFRNMVGAIYSQRALARLEEFLDAAERYGRLLAPEQEGARMATSIVWGAYHRHEPLGDELLDRIESFVERFVDVSPDAALRRHTTGGPFALTFAALQVPEIFGGSDRGMPRSRAFLDRRCARDEWPFIARFWDQLVVAGWMRPKPVFTEIGQSIVDVDAHRLSLRLNETIHKFELEDVRRAALDRDRLQAHAPDIKGAKDIRPLAVAQLLATLGTLRLAHPAEFDGFARRVELPESWRSLVVSLAHARTLRSVRDERMLSYAANYCQSKFEPVREVVLWFARALYADAERRRFRKPSHRHIARLAVGALEQAIDRLHAEQPPGDRQPAGGERKPPLT